MIRPRLIVLLLLFSVLPLMAITDQALGQSYTTITRLATITTQMAYTQAESVTAGSVVTTSTQQLSEAVYSGSVSIGAPSTLMFCGEYLPLNFTAVAGQSLNVSLTSDNKVDVYLMNDQEYKAYTQRGGVDEDCKPLTSPIIDKEDLTNTNFGLNIATSGTYYLILINLSRNSGVNMNVSVSLSSVSTATLNLQLFSATSTTVIEELTQTSTFVQEQTIQSGGFSTGSNLPLLVGIIIVIVAGVVGYVVFHGRKKISSGRTCGKCGAELALKAKFCKKCGATVE